MVSGYWFLVTGFWLLVSGYWFLVSGYWLLVSGFWLLVSGYWFLAFGFRLLPSLDTKLPQVMVTMLVNELSKLCWCHIAEEPVCEFFWMKAGITFNE